MIKEKIVINEHIQGDPLSEENLDKTLNFLRKIRLSFPNKSIWIYSGYSWDQLIEEYNQYKYTPFNIDADKWLTRYEIISKCDVMVDGRYIDSQRNPSKKWAGSDNQKVVNIRQSLQQNKIILWCN